MKYSSTKKKSSRLTILVKIIHESSEYGKSGSKYKELPLSNPSQPPPFFFFSPNTTELFSMKFIHSCFDTKTFWKPSSEKATLFTVLERIPCGHSRPTVTVTSTPGCLTGTWVMHKCGGAETKSSQGALKGVRIN